MNFTKTLIRIFILTCCITIISCSKDDNGSGKTPEEILTQRSWQAIEVRGQVGNTPVYYKRGGSSNSIILDNESFKFNMDGTGVYTANNQVQSTLVWSFTNPEKTKVTWTVQFTPVATVYWEISELTETSFKYIEYYSQGAINTFGSESRIPK